MLSRCDIDGRTPSNAFLLLIPAHHVAKVSDNFATPPAYTFGDVGRNSIYGPPLRTLDIAIVRSFRLFESSSFQFRGEAFNVLNMVNMGTPNRYVNEPQFGTVTMPMTPGREIQLSARLSF